MCDPAFIADSTEESNWFFFFSFLYVAQRRKSCFPTVPVASRPIHVGYTSYLYKNICIFFFHYIYIFFFVARYIQRTRVSTRTTRQSRRNTVPFKPELQLANRLVVDDGIINDPSMMERACDEQFRFAFVQMCQSPNVNVRQRRNVNRFPSRCTNRLLRVWSRTQVFFFFLQIPNVRQYNTIAVLVRNLRTIL